MRVLPCQSWRLGGQRGDTQPLALSFMELRDCGFWFRLPCCSSLSIGGLGRVLIPSAHGDETVARDSTAPNAEELEPQVILQTPHTHDDGDVNNEL